MKIRAHFVAAMLSLGLLVMGSALAGDPQIAPEERFRELELKWMNALADKNSAVLEQVLAQEFTIIGAGSPLEDPIATRQQWLEVGLKRPFPKHTIRVLSVHELQDAAVVHCILTADYRRCHGYRRVERSTSWATDTWVYRMGVGIVARHSSLPAKNGAP